MGRVVKTKKLKNARMLKEYASWIYCTSCEKTVAYLCYVTYDTFEFKFTCNCGCNGSVHIGFEELKKETPSSKDLEQINNRLCCPEDKFALVTFVEKSLNSYDCKISCLRCGKEYAHSK